MLLSRKYLYRGVSGLEYQLTRPRYSSEGTTLMEIIMFTVYKYLAHWNEVPCPCFPRSLVELSGSNAGSALVSNIRRSIASELYDSMDFQVRTLYYSFKFPTRMEQPRGLTARHFASLFVAIGVDLSLSQLSA